MVESSFFWAAWAQRKINVNEKPNLTFAGLRRRRIVDKMTSNLHLLHLSQEFIVLTVTYFFLSKM